MIHDMTWQWATCRSSTTIGWILIDSTNQWSLTSDMSRELLLVSKSSLLTCRSLPCHVMYHALACISCMLSLLSHHLMISLPPSLPLPLLPPLSLSLSLMLTALSCHVVYCNKVKIQFEHFKYIDELEACINTIFILYTPSIDSSIPYIVIESGRRADSRHFSSSYYFQAGIGVHALYIDICEIRR